MLIFLGLVYNENQVSNREYNGIYYFAQCDMG